MSPSPEELLLQNLPYVERVARNGARRHGLRPEDAEDFVSELKVKLIADDYAVIRKFKGQSAFTTYLTAVTQHCLLDYRNRLWGKWRPSAEAVRQGTLAVLLERLLVRDGHSLDEACEIIRTNHRLEATRPELEAVAQALPGRTRTRADREPADVVREVPDAARRPDERLLEEEREAERERLAQALRRTVERLPAEDRVIVRLRMDDGFTVSEIARTLHLEAKPLYRRLEAILKKMRSWLEDEGVDAAAVARLTEEPAPVSWAPSWENMRRRSSETLGRV
jgi:RNA polymerase sigma factor (sigma-70 family)